MAKSRIQGISIVIDGQTQGLQKALQDVNKKTYSLQSELREVDRLLKFDPKNTDLLAQKQELLQQQVENTNKKLKKLKDAYEQVEAQAKSGKIGEEKFRAFQREIADTQTKLNKFESELKNIDGSGSKSISTLRKLFGNLGKSVDNTKKQTNDLETALVELGGAIGSIATIQKAIDGAMEQTSLNTQVELSLGELDASELESTKELLGTLEAYGQDSSEAIESIRRQMALNKDASIESTQEIVKNAGVLATAYSTLDMTEIVAETNKIADALNITDLEAQGVLESLLSVGFDPNQLDTIAEYSNQFTRLGLSAEDSMNLVASGVASGTNNIDQLMDGIKEGRILMSEFGNTVDEETSNLYSQIGISTNQLQTWGQAVASGGEEGKQAMIDVANALLGVEDKTLRNAIGVKTFGTLYEEQGDKILTSILGMQDGTIKLGDGLDGINSKTETLNADPMVKFKEAMTDLAIAMTPLIEMVADIVGAIATWVSNNPQLSATIAVIVGVLGTLVGIMIVLVPLMSALAVAVGAVSAPVLIVIGVIVALIAIIAVLVINWEWIKTKTIEIWTAIKEWFAQTWENIKTGISNFLTSIKEWFANAWESIKTTISNVWTAIKDFFKEHWDTILTIMFGAIGKLVVFLVENWDSIKNTISNVWNGIKDFFSSIVSNIWSTITDKFNSLKDSVSNAMSNVKTAISNIWDSIMNFFKGIDLFQIGVDMIQGLIDGIKNMASKAVDAVGGVVNGLIEGAKWLLDINSPSKVFRGIGNSVGEGFVEGIDQMSEAVTKAGQDMADGSIPTIKQPKINNKTITNLNTQPQVIYLTTENYLDSRLIGAETTKKVISNMSRSTKNYRVGKGGYAY